MVSKLLRRVHMYLGLFLAPWMLMYALSTLMMNHRELFAPRQGEGPPIWLKEREETFSAALPGVEDREATAHVLLASLGLDGAHGVNRRAGDGALVIQRMDLLEPRRIVFTPADRKVVVEHLAYTTTGLLERMHRRRGFQTGYATDDLWAFSVDTVIFAMVFWALSGLWLWWEMKVTRKLGALAALASVALFVYYLAVL